MPGPEAQHYKLQTSCPGVLAIGKESSGSLTSSWDPQEDHVHLVGKNKGVKGAVCTRTDYPLYGMSCQAAATGAAHDCVLAVPPTLGARGREDDKTGPNSDNRLGLQQLHQRILPGEYSNSAGGILAVGSSEGFEKVT